MAGEAEPVEGGASVDPQGGTEGLRQDETAENRQFRWSLLVVIAASILVRLIHRAPSLGSDDLKWVLVGQEAVTGVANAEILDVYRSRPAFTLLLAAWSLIAGPSVSSAMLLMLILVAATVATVVAAGKIAGGRTVGIIAGMAYGLHPIAVRSDPYVLPDSLAVLLLSGVLACLFRWHREGASSWLMLSGLLAGFSYAAKSYYVLALLPILVAICLTRVPVRERVRHVSVVCLAGAGGLVVAALLQLAQGYSPFEPGHGVEVYRQRLIERGVAADGGLRGMALGRLLGSRFEYGLTVFLPSSGPLALAGIGALASGIAAFPRSFVSRTLVLVVVMFTGFLALAPVSVSPLILVEMQARYLTVLLPPLAILSASLLASVWARVREGAMRSAVLPAVALALAWCAWLPGVTWEHYRVMHVLATGRVGEVCRAAGITEVDFPLDWRLTVPPEVLGTATKFHYRDPKAVGSVEETERWLRQATDRAVYVPRASLEELRHALDFGDDIAEVGYISDATLVSVLRSASYREQPVAVPYDSFHVWLERLGLRARGYRVGTLFIRPERSLVAHPNPR
jgi:hypothetical protein